MPRAAKTDLYGMVAELLLGCVFGGIAGTFLSRRDRQNERIREDECTRQLSIELALHVAERTPVDGELRVPRRMVERILMLGGKLGLDSVDVRAAALAAALPAGASADTRLPLPDGTRQALGWRHAREDGLGLPPTSAASPMPAPAQLLAAADWLEMRDGASIEAIGAALRDESGRRFSSTVVATMLACLPKLLAAGPADGHLGLRVTAGALLCISAVQPDSVPTELRPAFLAALETRVREKLRTSDRVYTTDGEVVIWLAACSPDAAVAVMRRIEVLVTHVPVPCIQRLEIACKVGLAIADTDATSFTELVQTARARSVGAERRVA